jgi:drug/metabolite transporter (DMT)-like permease
VKLSNWLELSLLALIWGGSFLAMRVAAPEFGPLALIEMRLLLAVLVLLPWILSRRFRPHYRSHARHLLFVGAINSAIPFTLYAYATLSLAAGYTSVINATAPLWTAAVGWFWLRQKLSRPALAGLLVGLTGVGVLMSQKMGHGALSLLAVGAALLAALYYGIGANYTREHLHGVPPLAIAAGSQLAAMVLLLPLATANLPTTMPSPEAWLAVIVLGVVCTGIAYVLYFRLIAQVGPTRAITVTYLIPVFGVLLGALVLQETITWHMVIGGAGILAGVALASRGGR